MHPLIDYINVFFGVEWINEKWIRYLDKRGSYSPVDFTSESLIEEISLHPLIYLAADSQDLESKIFDFNKVPHDSGNYNALLFLGRDLKLMEKEIKARGDRIKKSLKRSVEYDSARFCILVAAAYKLLGYNVEFLPEKKDKMPDLLVNKGEFQFVIECKQKNQKAADKERYEMFIKLVSLINPILVDFKLTQLSIEIKVNVNKNNLFEEIGKEIINSLSSKIYSSITKESFTVKFAKAQIRNYYDLYVNNPSNVNKVVYFTRAVNYFIFTDPRRQNLFLLNKHYAEDLLPANLYNLILDANKKTKNGNKLILHYDFGISDSNWANIVANKLHKEISENNNKYEEIDLFVFSQTIPKNIEHQLIYKPDFKVLGKKSRLGNIPIEMIFGQQGETGMDNYFADLENYK